MICSIQISNKMPNLKKQKSSADCLYRQIIRCLSGFIPYSCPVTQAGQLSNRSHAFTKGQIVRHGWRINRACQLSGQTALRPLYFPVIHQRFLLRPVTGQPRCWHRNTHQPVISREVEWKSSAEAKGYFQNRLKFRKRESARYVGVTTRFYQKEDGK